MKRLVVLLVSAALGLGLVPPATGAEHGSSNVRSAAASPALAQEQAQAKNKVQGKAHTQAKAKAKAKRVTVVAAGDIACPPGRRPRGWDCQQARTASVAWKQRPRAVLALGDQQMHRGDLSSYRRVYHQSWGALRGITWPIPGNHEYDTRGARGYYRYFKGRAAQAPGYYRKSINGWQLYLLNSNCDQISCKKQRTWLDRQMRQHPSRCSLITHHHPRYSSGDPRGGHPWAVGLWTVAHKHGVDLALSGHDHHYERFAPKNNRNKVQPRRGIQQLVVGTGGTSRWPRDVHAKGSRKFIGDRHGVLRLSLRPNGYTWQFRDVRNRVLDSGYRSCH